MPSLNDPNFNRSVTLICEHSPQNGAMGVVLNQPTSMNAQELLAQLNIQTDCESLQKMPVFAGGPVQPDRGFIVHDSAGTWSSSLAINDDLHITSSNDILESIAAGQGPDHSLIALGYAGWAPGQLEAEIAANSWLTVDYRSELVFDTPADKQWLEAGNLLGIDLNLLSSNAGHA